MIIHCTRKLLDSAKIYAVPSQLLEEDPLFSWHANVLTIERRKLLIFVNDLSGITIMFYRPKASDYSKLSEILLDGIKSLMKELGFHDDVTERYLKDDKINMITRTSFRSLIRRMNSAGKTAEYLSYDFTSDYGLQMTGMVRGSREISFKKDGYSTAYELFVKEISDRYGDGTEESVLDHESYVLKIRLDLTEHDIYRIVELPADLTFYDLHFAIQEMFGWFDCHMHDFTVWENNRPVICIYDGSTDPEDIYRSPGCTYLSDMGVRLKEILEKHDSCIYTYDMGDNWEHKIEVLERKKKGSARGILIERKGDRPPEDVGGEGGYEEYLRIILDPEDPEYEEISEWAKEQLPEEITDEELSRRLSWIKC